MTHANKLWMTEEPQPLVCTAEIFQLIPTVWDPHPGITNFLNGPKVHCGSVAPSEGQW